MTVLLRAILLPSSLACKAQGIHAWLPSKLPTSMHTPLTVPIHHAHTPQPAPLDSPLHKSYAHAPRPVALQFGPPKPSSLSTLPPCFSGPPDPHSPHPCPRRVRQTPVPITLHRPVHHCLRELGRDAHVRGEAAGWPAHRQGGCCLSALSPQGGALPPPAHGAGQAGARVLGPQGGGRAPNVPGARGVPWMCACTSKHKGERSPGRRVAAAMRATDELTCALGSLRMWPCLRILNMDSSLQCLCVAFVSPWSSFFAGMH